MGGWKARLNIHAAIGNSAVQVSIPKTTVNRGELFGSRFRWVHQTTRGRIEEHLSTLCDPNPQRLAVRVELDGFDRAGKGTGPLNGSVRHPPAFQAPIEADGDHSKTVVGKRHGLNGLLVGGDFAQLLGILKAPDLDRSGTSIAPAACGQQLAVTGEGQRLNMTGVEDVLGEIVAFLAVHDVTLAIHGCRVPSVRCDEGGWIRLQWKSGGEAGQEEDGSGGVATETSNGFHGWECRMGRDW